MRPKFENACRVSCPAATESTHTILFLLLVTFMGFCASCASTRSQQNAHVFSLNQSVGIHWDTPSEGAFAKGAFTMETVSFDGMEAVFLLCPVIPKGVMSNAPCITVRLNDTKRVCDLSFLVFDEFVVHISNIPVFRAMHSKGQINNKRTFYFEKHRFAEQIRYEGTTLFSEEECFELLPDLMIFNLVLPEKMIP